MILEAMNNQYLIAEHYYDLTEYIDKNIYKFRRNGKYLQEGFGTVALWIAGIALAAGIGWWVYKKFFDKNNDKKKEDQTKATEQQLIQSESEQAEVVKEINQANPNSTPMETVSDFIGSQSYQDCMKACAKELNDNKDNAKVQEIIIKNYAKMFATKFQLDENEVKIQLGIDDVKQAQKDAKAQRRKLFWENLKGLAKKVYQTTIGKVIIGTIAVATAVGIGVLIPPAAAALGIQSVSLLSGVLTTGAIAGVAKGGQLTYQELIKELNEQPALQSQNYRKSIKAAFYILDYFNAMEVLLTQDKYIQQGTK